MGGRVIQGKNRPPTFKKHHFNVKIILNVTMKFDKYWKMHINYIYTLFCCLFNGKKNIFQKQINYLFFILQAMIKNDRIMTLKNCK